MQTNVLHNHLIELKFRCFYLLLCLIANFLTCYTFCLEIIYIFTKPFLQYKKSFIFIDVTEFFYTTIEICLFFSIYLIFPIVVYQVWCFFIPSSYLQKRLNILVTILIVITFIYSSILVVYFFILPKLFAFLTYFMVHNNLLSIELQPRIRSYVYLACKVFFVFTFFSFLPLLFFYLIKNSKISLVNKNSTGPLHSCVFVKNGFLSNLCENRIRNYFIIFVLASMFTPPDMILQFCVSLIFIGFLEILQGLGFIYIRILAYKSHV